MPPSGQGRPAGRRFLPPTSAHGQPTWRYANGRAAHIPIRRNHLSTTDDLPAAPALAVADPAPLGLAGFALTTFLLSAANAKWMSSATGDAWLGYAFAYGGLAQLLAGMWEFRNRNVFGATAFGTYGSFWIGLGLWVLLVARHAPPAGMTATAYGAATGKDLAWILLAFAIFNTYMLICSMQLNVAIFGVFLTLEATEILLFIGGFAANANIIKIGGFVGVLTALVAWYTSAAGVLTGMAGRPVLPVGKPLLSFTR
jgi:uncharacterized protein